MKRIIKISEYPYSKVYSRLKKAANWINKYQNVIVKKLSEEKSDVFDFDDYWDMPRPISYKLSSDEVDFIQQQTHDFYLEKTRDGY